MGIVNWMGTPVREPVTGERCDHHLTPARSSWRCGEGREAPLQLPTGLGRWLGSWRVSPRYLWCLLQGLFLRLSYVESGDYEMSCHLVVKRVHACSSYKDLL